VARVRLTGATPLAWRIRRDLDLLKTEADDRAAVIGACSVEKLEVACETPDGLVGSADNPVGELRRLIDEEVIRSESFQAEVVGIVEELRTQLPQECRN
jgi:exonuclease SbcD